MPFLVRAEHTQMPSFPQFPHAGQCLATDDMLLLEPKLQERIDRGMPAPVRKEGNQCFLQIAPANDAVGEWPPEESREAFTRNSVFSLERYAKFGAHTNHAISIENKGFHFCLGHVFEMACCFCGRGALTPPRLRTRRRPHQPTLFIAENLFF